MSREIEAPGQIVQPIVLQTKDTAKLATGAGVSLVGRMTGRGLQVLGQVLLARLLGPEGFGLYAIGWTILRMAGMIAPLGLNYGVISFGSRYWRRDPSSLRSVLYQSLRLALLSGLLIGGVFYFAAPWLAEQVFQKPDLTPVLRWFALAFPLMTGMYVAASATQVTQRIKFAVYTRDAGQPMVNLILMLFFCLLGWGLLGAVAASVASFGLTFVLALYYVKYLFPEAFSAPLKSTTSTRELLAFSMPTALAGMFGTFLILVDRLFVGYFLPTAEVGIYQAVSQSSMLFAIIVNSFNAIFSPMIADLYHKKEMERLEELFRVSTKWGLYLSLPVFLVIFFAPRELLTVVFGHQYASGAWPLVILIVAQLINVGTGAVGFMLIMTGRQNRWSVISAITLVVDIGMHWLLIPRLGLAGAALATAGAVSGLFLSGLFLVRRSLGMWPYDRRYLKGMAAAGLAASALLLLDSVTVGFSSPVLSLLSKATVSSSVFVIALLVLGLDTEDYELIRLIQTRLDRPREG